MDREEVIRRVGRVALVDPATEEQAVVESLLDDVRRVAAWLQAREIACAKRLGELIVYAEPVIAAVSHTSVREASRVTDRAATVETAPGFGAALAAGSISGAHVDVVTGALRSMNAADRPALVARSASLVSLAAGATVDEFAAAVRREVRAIEADNGESRLIRQRRGCRARTWIDRASGMWRLDARFDPERGMILQNRLDAAVAGMFAKIDPPDAPDDPGDKVDHQRALALYDLTTSPGRAGRPPRPEITVVIDTRDLHPDNNDRSGGNSGPGNGNGGGGGGDGGAPPGGSAGEGGGGYSHGAPPGGSAGEDGGGGAGGRGGNSDGGGAVGGGNGRGLGRGSGRREPRIDWGLPVELPPSVLTRLLTDATNPADIAVVLVDNGTVVKAPGRTDLGRSTRLANRAQRRALRALHPTCGVPGCDVRFGNCQPHHVRWWRHGGRTDLSNLLPLCSRHHHLVHDHGWQITLHPNRTVTVTVPP